jgi:hypothetical protein
LLALDVAALRNGAVPGGAPLLAVTAVLAVAAAGVAGVLLAAIGAHPGRWRDAAREVPLARTVPAAAGIVALAALPAALVHPVLVPVLAGYTLFALHVVTRRLAARTVRSGAVA